MLFKPHLADSDFKQLQNYMQKYKSEFTENSQNFMSTIWGGKSQNFQGKKREFTEKRAKFWKSSDLQDFQSSKNLKVLEFEKCRNTDSSKLYFF